MVIVLFFNYNFKIDLNTLIKRTNKQKYIICEIIFVSFNYNKIYK